MPDKHPHDDKNPGTVATRLEQLFATVHPPTGPYTNEHVAAAIQSQSGVSMHPSYIWRLRTGQRRNPHPDKIAAIARFFKVPVAYFYDEEFAMRIDKQLVLLATARDAGIQQFAARGNDMSVDEKTEALLNMAEQMIAERRTRGQSQ